MPPRQHPQAVTVLVLGLLGVLVCGATAPFAWIIGNRALAEIDAQPAVFGGRTETNIGRILGIVGTAILAFSALLLIGFFGLFVLGGLATM